MDPQPVPDALLDAFEHVGPGQWRVRQAHTSDLVAAILAVVGPIVYVVVLTLVARLILVGW